MFFFSSRRRHTRCSRDWSSDVCSSDLFCLYPGAKRGPNRPQTLAGTGTGQSGRPAVASIPRSEERRVGKSVDLGGRRIMKKKKKKELKEKKDSNERISR